MLLSFHILIDSRTLNFLSFPCHPLNSLFNRFTFSTSFFHLKKKKKKKTTTNKKTKSRKEKTRCQYSIHIYVVLHDWHRLSSTWSISHLRIHHRRHIRCVLISSSQKHRKTITIILWSNDSTRASEAFSLGSDPSKIIFFWSRHNSMSIFAFNKFITTYFSSLLSWFCSLALSRSLCISVSRSRSLFVMIAYSNICIWQRIVRQRSTSWSKCSKIDQEIESLCS